MGRYTQKISQRLIPLPKEISCNDIKKVAFNDVKIDVIFPEMHCSFLQRGNLYPVSVIPFMALSG
jgi:hypothetical protein